MTKIKTIIKVLLIVLVTTTGEARLQKEDISQMSIAYGSGTESFIEVSGYKELTEKQCLFEMVRLNSTQSLNKEDSDMLITSLFYVSGLCEEFFPFDSLVQKYQMENALHELNKFDKEYKRAEFSIKECYYQEWRFMITLTSAGAAIMRTDFEEVRELLLSVHGLAKEFPDQCLSEMDQEDQDALNEFKKQRWLDPIESLKDGAFGS